MLKTPVQRVALADFGEIVAFRDLGTGYFRNRSGIIRTIIGYNQQAIAVSRSCALMSLSVSSNPLLSLCAGTSTAMRRASTSLGNTSFSLRQAIAARISIQNTKDRNSE